MHKICKNCKHYVKGNKGLANYVFIPSQYKYDGWCKHFDEDRDHNESICEYYELKPDAQEEYVGANRTSFGQWMSNLLRNQKK